MRLKRPETVSELMEMESHVWLRKLKQILSAMLPSSVQQLQSKKQRE